MEGILIEVKKLHSSMHLPSIGAERRVEGPCGRVQVAISRQSCWGGG
jgi:hypothetical protein